MTDAETWFPFNASVINDKMKKANPDFNVALTPYEKFANLIAQHVTKKDIETAKSSCGLVVVESKHASDEMRARTKPDVDTRTARPCEYKVL